VRRQAAFTLVELALVLAVIGILSTMAVASYLRFQERARQSQAIVDLKSISTALDGHEISAGQLPATLAELGVEFSSKIDPWGNAYVYTPVATSPVGKLRKDKFLVPINSDYDLYSKGPDGASVASLQAAASRDDVVRASNGSFYGTARNY
jgi:general secretion pathway protein G